MLLAVLALPAPDAGAASVAVPVLYSVPPFSFSFKSFALEEPD